MIPGPVCDDCHRPALTTWDGQCTGCNPIRPTRPCSKSGCHQLTTRHLCGQHRPDHTTADDVRQP